MRFMKMVHETGTGFLDRNDAGEKLADALRSRVGPDTVVLGIPRGGVAVALPVASALEAQFEVLPARKIGAEYQPELAIGAVTADGGVYLDRQLIQILGTSEAYVGEAVEREIEEAQRRLFSYSGNHSATSLDGNTVVIVDDGLATGATARAAIKSVRMQQPAKLLLAVPVASEEAVVSLSRLVDEVVYLICPDSFLAVGHWYADFHQLTDLNVTTMIANWRHQRSEIA